MDGLLEKKVFRSWFVFIFSCHQFLSTERSQYYPLYFPYGDIFHSIPMTVPNPYGPEREVVSLVSPYLFPPLLPENSPSQHRTLACHFPPERVFPTVLTPIYGGTLSVRFPQDHDYWLTKVIPFPLPFTLARLVFNFRCLFCVLWPSRLRFMETGGCQIVGRNNMEIPSAKMTINRRLGSKELIREKGKIHYINIILSTFELMRYQHRKSLVIEIGEELAIHIW